MALIPLTQLAGALTISLTTGEAPQPHEPTTLQPPAAQEPEASVAVPPANPPAEQELETQTHGPPALPATLPEPGQAAPPATPVAAGPPPQAAAPPPVAPHVSDAPSVEPEPPSPTAKRPRALAPTDKRSFFSIGVGGSTPALVGYNGGMDFGWQMALGRHTRKWPGFSGAFVLQQRRGLLNELTFAGRLAWDRPLNDAFALYSSVSFDFGVNVPIGYGSYLGFGYPPSGLLGVGWSLKAILFERMLLGIKPVSANLVVPSFGSQFLVGIRWDVIATLGVVW